MMKKIFSLSILFLLISIDLFAQFQLPAQKGYGWINGEDGFYVHKIPWIQSDVKVSKEFQNYGWVDVYDIPFKAEFNEVDFCGSGTEAIEELAFDFPELPREALFLIYADFPEMEMSGFEGNEIPLNVLSEPERIQFEIQYSDGSSEEVIPINADNRLYGVTRGRALYSLKARHGKRITKVVFQDKMRNASFHIIGATGNINTPIIADPPIAPYWYPESEKVQIDVVDFRFNYKQGLSWKGIKTSMLPSYLDLKESPVFNLQLSDKDLPSNSWNVLNTTIQTNGIKIQLDYLDEDLNLKATLLVYQTRQNEIEMSLDMENMGNKSVDATLHFPIIENLSIGSVENTWYAFARDGLVVSKVPCEWRDYIGSEKPLQYDGIFNPDIGSGIAFFPRDTTDLFRWYHLSKTNQGIRYALEYTPSTIKQGEKWKSVKFALAVIPGDWKDQFEVYQNWKDTWYKPIAPRIDWFQKAFAFSIDNAYEVPDPDIRANAMQFKNRWGDLDLYHIWGWSYIEEKKIDWGDYNDFHNLGGLEKLRKNISYFQDSLNIPFALYIDAYLMSTRALNVPDSLKKKWAIKGIDGEYIYPFDSYAMCPEVKEWREYLIDVYKRLDRDLGLKAIYNDETGMYMKSRVCYNTDHNHPVPSYHSQGEGDMIKEIKKALPKTAVYNELGASDVMSQYCDGSFGYTTFWGKHVPQRWGNPSQHMSYDIIAPHYLHLKRFACPDFKVFELNMFETPWRDGNWYIAKFPFFNGNGYYHRFDDGTDADEEALELFRRIRLLQEMYKNEFSSMDVEPMVRTEIPNMVANRFSSQANDIYTLFNGGFRTSEGIQLVFDLVDDASYINVWDQQKIDVIELPNGKVGLSFKVGPRSLSCIVVKKRVP